MEMEVTVTCAFIIICFSTRIVLEGEIDKLNMNTSKKKIGRYKRKITSPAAHDFGLTENTRCCLTLCTSYGQNFLKLPWKLSLVNPSPSAKISSQPGDAGNFQVKSRVTKDESQVPNHWMNSYSHSWKKVMEEENCLTFLNP